MTQIITEIGALTITDLTTLGLVGAWLTTVILLGIAIWIYSGFALMAIAKKTKTPDGWLGFIPIANFYLITQTAKQSGWWTLALLLGLIPGIGGLALTIISIWLMWKTAERLKFGGWTAILMIVPIINLIMLGLYAWAKPFGR